MNENINVLTHVLERFYIVIHAASQKWKHANSELACFKLLVIFSKQRK